jgi:hypothetical protein
MDVDMLLTVQRCVASTDCARFAGLSRFAHDQLAMSAQVFERYLALQMMQRDVAGWPRHQSQPYQGIAAETRRDASRQSRASRSRKPVPPACR